MYDFAALHWCKGARVLEVGVGYGYGISVLAPKSLEVVGIDTFHRCIEHSRKVYPFPNVRYEQVDICTWEEPGQSFDVAVMIDIIEHIRNPKLALHNIYRLLKPRGILFVSTPWPNLEAGGNPVNPHHIREYYPDEFYSTVKEVFPDAVLYSKEEDNLMIIAQKGLENEIKPSLYSKHRQLFISAFLKASEASLVKCSAEKIKKVIDGRNVAILLHGSSVAELESHTKEISDLDVCFCSMNFFRAPEERILKPAGKRLSIVFCSSEEDIVKRSADLAEFLGRADNNLLITTEEAGSLVPEIIIKFSDKICFVETPILPKNLMPNSLNVLLQVLLKTETSSQCIALFGADGLLVKGANISETYYGKESLQKEKRTWNLVSDTVLFNFTFPLILNKITDSYTSQPFIINCSPASNISVFSKNSQLEGLALLKSCSKYAERQLTMPISEVEDIETEYRNFSVHCTQGECVIIWLPIISSGPTPQEWIDFAQNGKVIAGHGTYDDAMRVIDIALSTKPELVDSCLGYNLINHDGRIYCLSISAGDVDVEYLDDDTINQLLAEGKLYIVSSIEEGKAILGEKKWVHSPCLVESVLGYNIVRYHDLFYAIDTCVGEFDLTAVSEPEMDILRKTYKLFSARSISELKEVIRHRKKNNGVVHDVDFNCCLSKEKRKALIFIAEENKRSQQFPELEGYEVWHLVPRTSFRKSGLNYLTYDSISFADGSALREFGFSLVVFEYRKNLEPQGIEGFILSFADQALALFPNGERRLYSGTTLTRLQYNSSYLRSMYASIPPFNGKKILEIGCSDGLTCDLVAIEGAGFVVGVDSAPPRGPLFQHPRCSHHVMDAHSLSFADEVFDVVFSIATMEHCQDPYTVFREIKRVLKPGGYAYIQAGPLYYSPFGHHMFGYFDDYPWIHIRLSADEILDYCCEKGIDSVIEQQTGVAAKEYLSAMLNRKHINGLSIAKYKLDEFTKHSDVEVVVFKKSYEGENILSQEICNEIKNVSEEDLVLHGFELVFRRAERKE